MNCCEKCGRPFRKPSVKKGRFHISMFSAERLQWSIDVLMRAAERYPELEEACYQEIDRLERVMLAKELPKAA